MDPAPEQETEEEAAQRQAEHEQRMAGAAPTSSFVDKHKGLGLVRYSARVRLQLGRRR